MSAAPVDKNEGFGKLLAAGRNLWLAGLGAAAAAEGGGRDLFDRLVERGRPWDERRKKTAATVSERATRAARGLRKLVQDKVEHESRGMLKRLNVMTREDVKILSARLETLSKKLDDYAARRQATYAIPIEIPPTQAAAASRPRPRKTER